MKKISFLLVLLFTCLIAKAQVISDADRQIVQKIIDGNTKYTSFVADFKQIQYMDFLDEGMVSVGKCYYKKPDRMAMKFTDPEDNMMLVDGDKFVLVADGQKREVSAKTNPKMQGMKLVLTSGMQGNALGMGAKKITCEETSKYYVITATLDTENNLFESVVASYDKKDFSLASLKTVESENNYTIYELSKKEFNKTIDNSIFNVK